MLERKTRDKLRNVMAVLGSLLAIGLAVLLGGCSHQPPAAVPPPLPNGPSQANLPGAHVTPQPTSHPAKLSPLLQLGGSLQQALIHDPVVQGDNLVIGVSAHTITLSGRVENAAQKAVAEQIARKRAPGYKIVDAIQVTGPVKDAP